MLGHLARLFSAMIIGLLFSYLVYRALVPLDGFLASILFLGLMMTTPITLILVFYNRLRWGMLFFIAVWLLYASAVWLYMLANFFTAVFPGQAWIPFSLLVLGGIVLLLLILRRRGISLPQAFRGKTGSLEETKEIQEVIEEPMERTSELKPQEEELDLSSSMGLLDEAHCRILITLLESGKPYSKKELAKAVGATYKRVEVSSLRNVERAQSKRVKAFKILGNTVVLDGNVFSVSGRLVSEVRLRSADYENNKPEIRMLQGLSATGFEGMFTVSYEPFNYEVRFSIASKSPRELSLMTSRLKASMLASCPGTEFELLRASIDNVLWPLGGLPISKRGNRLILLRGRRASAASFLPIKLKDNVLNLLEDSLENALRSSAESGCSLRFCVPVKSCRGFLHLLSTRIKKNAISSQYSKAYRELRKNELFNSGGELMGIDLDKSARLELLRSQYEKLNGQMGCWTCSPTIVVIGPPESDPKQVCEEQRKHVEAAKAAFSSSYRVKLEEIGWLDLREAVRSILARRIMDSNRFHMSSGELSYFINLPKPITPSFSYTPKRIVEFEAFNPAELREDGILLGYYESMGRRLDVRIGIEDLPLHLAIFGVPGSGKSTLTKMLLKRYRELGGSAMVFDRHGEYVEEFEDALLLNTGNARISLLEHHGDPEGHAKVLGEVFSMAWPDEFGPLVSHVFRRMYLKYVRKVSCPDFAEFLEFIEKSFEDPMLRSGKAKDKLFSLVGRLSELTQGSIGKVFDTIGERDGMMERLLSDMVVFDLSDMDTDRDANILTWLMLKRIYDFRRKKANSGLPHVVVCEEAHNIAPVKFEGQETVVEKMLREMRKFGESVWLIDQRPLMVSRDILGLCGTMICLRLQYSSDVEKIADTMHLNGEQRLKLQELKQGEAIALLPRVSTAIPIIL